MRSIAAAVAVAALLGAAAPSRADPGADLGAGMFAYDQGLYDQALAVWMPLAEAGDASAQSLVALMHRRGEGVAQSDALAAEWYRRAAEQGHAYARYNLGLILRDGVGVAPDPVRAHAWLDLAAEGIATDADGANSASRARDALAANLTPAQIAAATALANALRALASE